MPIEDVQTRDNCGVNISFTLTRSRLRHLAGQRSGMDLDVPIPGTAGRNFLVGF